MPREITDAELTELASYRAIGTPTEIRKKISDLETDNHSQRDQVREMKGKLPQEGQVLLSAEDGKKYTAYKALGEPAAVQTRLQEGDVAKAQVKSSEVRSQALTFGRVAGFADEAIDVLVAIPALQDARFEVRTKKDEKTQKEVQVPYITLAGDGQKAMSLDDAREKIPALKGLKMADQKGPTGGRTFVQQGPEAGTPAANDQQARLDRIRTEVKQRESGSQPKEGVKTPEERLGMTRTG